MSFRDFEADYQSQLDSVKKDINTLTFSLSQQNRGANKIYNRYDIVKRLLEQHSKMKGSLAHMELESNEGAPEQVAVWKKRLVEMKKEAFALEKEINRLKEDSSAADRADLINRSTATPIAAGSAAAGTAAASTATGAPNAPNATSSMDAHLGQLTQATATMNKGTNTLVQALRYVVRMNDLGQATLVELRRQDETVDRVMMTASEADTELTGAQRILRDMKAVAMKNNMMLAGTVIVLVMMIVGILYFKFGRPLAAYWNSTSSGNNGGAVIGAPSVAPSPSSSSPSTSSSTLSLDGLVQVPANQLANFVLQSLVPSG